MQIDARPALEALADSAHEHLPEILTGTGIGLVIASVTFAVIATVKAIKRLEPEDDVIYYENDESKANEEEIPDSEIAIRYHYQETHPDVDISDLDILEIVKLGKYKRRHKWKKIFKLIWKYYIPVILALAVGVACLIASTREGLQRTAALATAYQLTDTAFTEYRNKVVDTIGEKKERDIQTEIIKDKVKATPVDQDNPENGIYRTGDGETLCYDYIRGFFYRSDIEFQKRQVNRLNYEMQHDGLDGARSLNAYYQMINLPTGDIGELLGWRADWNIISYRDTSTNHPVTGEPAYIMSFVYPPKYGFDK